MANVNGKTEDGKKAEDGRAELLYGIEDNPPWPLCVLLGFQHYLTAFGSTLSVPLILAGPLCIGDDTLGLSEVIASIFFMSGLATILQTTVGVRLPIIQGATFAFLSPAASILNLPRWACVDNSTTIDGLESELTNLTTLASHNSTGPLNGGIHWHERMRGRLQVLLKFPVNPDNVTALQGAIIVSALFEVFVGFSGLFSLLMRYIGPLTITPVITLMGLSLFEVAAAKAATHWWIAFMTLALIGLFSQYLRRVRLPLPAFSRASGLTLQRLPIFGLFPILLAMLVSWLVCLGLTLTDVLTRDPDQWGYLARTDVRTDVLAESKWIRIPYPGQWGIPTVSLGAMLGMLAGVLASMMESVGDYYACARISGAPPPPPSAVSRGIGMEGISCIIAGLVGTGNGTTSYSENVGAIGITRVGSRRVVITAGVLLVILGCLGKVGALFVTLPDPVVGGMFMAMFGMITAVGLSNLQFVDMKSSRNIFIIATSIFVGLCFPLWLAKNKDAIKTGNDIVDQIIVVLLSTSMFVGGAVGFFMDITLPGTLRERGILGWQADSLTVHVTKPTDGLVDEEAGPVEAKSTSVYDFPWPCNLISRFKVLRYVPFCPARENYTVTKCTVYEGCNGDEKDHNHCST